MAWANLTIPLVLGIGTLVWAVWQWVKEQERERDKERDQLAALYVNPFMSACEDLQSRLYNLLEKNALPVLRERYPDLGYAEEFLYLIMQYFGWEECVSRYGPYTRDPEVIRLSQAIAAYSQTRCIGSQPSLRRSL